MGKVNQLRLQGILPASTALLGRFQPRREQRTADCARWDDSRHLRETSIAILVLWDSSRLGREALLALFVPVVFSYRAQSAKSAPLGSTATRRLRPAIIATLSKGTSVSRKVRKTLANTVALENSPTAIIACVFVAVSANIVQEERALVPIARLNSDS